MTDSETEREVEKHIKIKLEGRTIITIPDPEG